MIPLNLVMSGGILPLDTSSQLSLLHLQLAFKGLEKYQEVPI
jgi:hypothetical protein